MLIRAVTLMMVASLVSVAAACGGGSGGSGDSGGSGGSVSVGSKKFTEQILLGEMYAQAFEAADYDVERKLNL
ncbi:MAG: glycine betaine ABC transporter substrate-binding protein, partial [Rubrobacteraceae bacterium]